MREGIHPDYYQATVTCNCGNTFVTGSTKEDIHVEICSEVLIRFLRRTAESSSGLDGRIDKFNKKYGMQQAVRK